MTQHSVTRRVPSDWEKRCGSSGTGGVDPPVVTFTAVNIRDDVVEDVRFVVPSVCGRSDHVDVAVDNPDNADAAVIVLR